MSRRRLDGWMDDSIYSRFDDEVSFFSRRRRRIGVVVAHSFSRFISLLLRQKRFYCLLFVVVV